MPGCEFGHRVDNAASDAPAPCTDRYHDRRFIARADNHVMRAAGAMEEVPCSQPALLVLDDQKALTAQDEKTFLGVSRWYVPIASPGSRTLMLIPSCGNRRLPSLARASD
jgi:hypothetical protein